VDGVLDFLDLLGYDRETRDKLVCEQTPSIEVVEEAIAAVFQGGIQIVKARNAHTNADTLDALRQLHGVCDKMYNHDKGYIGWELDSELDTVVPEFLGVEGVRDFLQNLLDFKYDSAGTTFYSTIPTQEVLVIAKNTLRLQNWHDALGDSKKEMEVRSMTPMEIVGLVGQVLMGGRGRS